MNDLAVARGCVMAEETLLFEEKDVTSLALSLSKGEGYIQPHYAAADYDHPHNDDICTNFWQKTTVL
jgi:hypothetical protein